MDDLIFKLIWEDENIFELNIEAKTNYVLVNENVYFNKDKIKQLSNIILKYIDNPKCEIYYESGPKKGIYTPSFSISFKGLNEKSKSILEIEMEINDNDNRMHWCKFNLLTELSLLQSFANNILKLPDIKIVHLNNIE